MTIDLQSNADNLTILALDTCTECCSAALSYQGQVFAERADAPREHSQRILPMVQKLLADAKIGLDKVDLVAYGRGPGSFTGIRICTSMTQGLALGQDLPVIGMSTLAAMAQIAMNEHQAEEVIAAIDARMNEVYWAHFKCENGLATLVGQEQVSAPEVLVASGLTKANVFACGTGFDTYEEMLGDMSLVESAKFPTAEVMLSLAHRDAGLGLATDVEQLSPVYVRDTVTWKKLPGRE